MRLHELCAHARLAAVVSFACAGGVLSLPAHASALLKICTAEGLCGEAEAVSEARMGSVAGKFTVGGEVVGMQISMLSSWQAANGQKLEGNATLAIGLPGKGRSGYAVTHADARETAAAGPAMAHGSSGSVRGGSALNNVNGVAQVIQVAGNDNGASNLAAVEVTSGSLSAPAGNGLNRASYQAANNAEAKIDIAGNHMSVMLGMPDGAGAARQHVNLADGGGIRQNIQIASSGQQVVNQLRLQVQVKPVTSFGLAEQGLFQALGMLRGR